MKTIDVACLLGLVVFLMVAIRWLEDKQPTKAEMEAARIKLGCVATNEFIGKDGDRLYLCNDGLKYKYASIRQYAYEEKNK